MARVRLERAGVGPRGLGVPVALALESPEVVPRRRESRSSRDGGLECLSRFVETLQPLQDQTTVEMRGGVGRVGREPWGLNKVHQ